MIPKGARNMRYILMLNLIWLLLLVWFGVGHAESSPVFVNMEVIKQIESSGNSNAYNASSRAYGWFQITPICLVDFNKANNTHYSLSELFDPQINSRVAYWYFEERIPQILRRFKKPDTIKNRIVCYNAGISHVLKNKIPNETVKYIRKYNDLQKL